MFNELTELSKKPELFSVYTAEQLWTKPHLAKQMLAAHLSQETPMASRPLAAVERVVAWLDNTFGLSGKSICDLGCGPGLYTEKYALHGATVHGLDFSTNSIQYARQSAVDKQLDITYQVANYLSVPLPVKQDLITLIYCDLCALSPTQRQQLYKQIRQSLRPEGRFVFDVFSLKALDGFTEHHSYGRNYMHGFWSDNPYYTFHNAFYYRSDHASLDHFTVVEADQSWDVYNWMQYFSHDTIRRELEENGFDVVDMVNGFDSDERSESSFGVIAKLKA